MSNQFNGFLVNPSVLLIQRHIAKMYTAPVWHKMMGAIRLIRHSVSPATVTYPSPLTLVILRRKSTEFRLGGFHLRMSSHLPALYGCRDNQSPPPPPKKMNNVEDFMEIQ